MTKSKISEIKHTFFNVSVKINPHYSFNDDEFNLDQLRIEFSTLYQLFQSNKEYWSKNAAIILYMGYLSDLLIQYYQKDYVRSDLLKIQKQQHEIKLFIDEHFTENQHERINDLRKFILNRIKNNAQNYKKALSEISTFTDYLNLISTNRSKISYSRALAIDIINFIASSPLSDLIQEINIILGNQLSFVDGINFLNKSREAMAILGTILYSLRFLINLMLILKHTIQAALDKDLSTKKVLHQELIKRGFIMASDFAWSVVTLIANFNTLFNVSASTVPMLFAIFLVYDAVLFLIQWYFETEQYVERMRQLLHQKESASNFEHAVIQRQIDLINDEWEAQTAYYRINILGACVIASSYAISFICVSSLGLAGLTLCSMFGNALYNTACEFKAHERAKVSLKRERKNGLVLNDGHHQQLINKLQAEVDETYKQFIENLAFNVGGIAFIITAAVISWPIAVCLTLSYIGYQLNATYQKQLHTTEKDEVEHDIYRQLSVC